MMIQNLNVLQLLLFKLSFALIALAATSTYNVVPAQSPIAQQSPQNAPGSTEAPFDVKAYVDAQAAVFGVNPLLADCIVENESKWRPNNIGPEKVGESYGLWQIHLIAHPDITKAEALDPVFSTNWSLTQIKNGNVSIWSTYDEDCSSTPVKINQ